MTDRRTALGAADVAAVMGLNPHRSPLAVWAEKTASEPLPQVDTEDTLRGHAMEPVIEVILRHRGIALEPGGEWAIDGTPLVVHPDRLFVARGGGVEMKAPRRWSAQWGEDGTDDVPTEYLAQVTVQMAALRANGRDADEWVVAAMCGDLRTYPVPFRQETADRIIDYCVNWWHRHVVKGEPPPATTAEELNQVVARVPSVQVGEDMARRIAQLKTLRKIETRAKDLGDEVRRAILAELAVDDHLPESIAGPTGEIIATTRRGGRAVVDVEGIRGVDPDLVERFTRRSEWNELRPAKRLPLLAMPEILALEVEA